MLKIFVLCVAVAAANAAGGWSDANPTDPHVSDLVDFAATSLNARSNSILMRRAEKVVKVQKQLVNGLNWKIDFVFSLTKCNKYSTKEQLGVCGVYQDRDQLCSVKIYESFSHEKQLNDFSCTALRSSKRSMPKARGCAGCVSDELKNPDDYMGLYISAYGVAKTNMDINNINILSVRTQVVSGIRYYMKVQTSEAGEPRVCDVTFIVQLWVSPNPSNVKFDCKPTQ